MRSLLILLLLATMIPMAEAKGPEGPVLAGPFSLSGEPMKDTPFSLLWHPGKNIAAFFLRYPQSHVGDQSKDKRYAQFAHVYSLDQDRVVLSYEGFNISFCHEYPVVGDVPKRFWHSVQQSGSGKCEDDTPVTWYEGKFSTLFVPYGIKTFKIGYDKSERPVCVEITHWDSHHKKESEERSVGDGHALGAGDSILQRHIRTLVAHYADKKGSSIFSIDFDDTPPTMNELFPSWLARKCDNKHAIADDEAAANEAHLAAVLFD